MTLTLSLFLTSQFYSLVCFNLPYLKSKYSKDLRQHKHHNVASWNCHPWRQSRSCRVRILWPLFCQNASLSSWVVAWSSMRGMRRSDPHQASISADLVQVKKPPSGVTEITLALGQIVYQPTGWVRWGGGEVDVLGLVLVDKSKEWS